MTLLLFGGAMFILLLVSLFDAVILKWIATKEINIPVSYKRSLAVSILFKSIILIITAIAPLILGISDSSQLIYWFLFSLILDYLIFYSIFSKYYGINLSKGIVIFILYFLFVALLCGVPYEVRFVKEMYIMNWHSDKIGSICYNRHFSCAPSLICASDPGCTGNDTCLATSMCRPK